jgi:ubiquinone biosynthesis protein
MKINTARATGRKNHLARYRQIVMVLMKYDLKEPIEALGLEKYLPLRWMPPAIPWRKTPYSKPERMRFTLEDLGTTFVKMGQILSTRPDLIPADYISQLVKLQDSLKQLPIETVKEVIASELGNPVEKLFETFDPQAIGVASIGQVHAATLKDGTEVVVKVQKPGVREQVDEDMEILHHLALSAVDSWEGAHQYDLIGIVQETAETLRAEMDYVREGHSAEYFANFFRDGPRVHIPRIYWDYTTSRVITMERFRGISILNTQALEKAGFDRKELAVRSADLWLKMIFEGGAFHCDPHPGNLFIEEDGNLALIDFGMIGMVDDEVREHLAMAVKAILDRNVDLLIDSLIDLGAVNQGSARNTLRGDLKHIMGHYPKLDIAELQGNSSLGELLTILQRNHVQMPSNTFLLLKTVAMVQSLGKGIDKNFDILPLLEGYIKRELARKRSLSRIIGQVPSTIADLTTFGAGLPERLGRLMKSVERGDIQVRSDVSGLEIHLEHLERIARRMTAGIIVSAIIVGVALLVLAYRLGH